MKLKMKSYIQPFEKKLGILELKRVANVDVIEPSEDDIYEIETEVPLEILIQNLAYWETVGECPARHTFQVIMENTYHGEQQYEQMNLLEKNETNIRKTRILRYGVHDLHEYRGKFFPQLVRACINISGVKPGSLVFDPFCGSGTTLCEAGVRGMRAAGIDLNPLSVLISRVKTGVLSLKKQEIVDACENLKHKIDPDMPEEINRWNTDDFRYLSGWFAKDALADIAILLRAIDTIKPEIIADLFRVNLSNIIREISWQKDSDLRVRKEVGIYKKGMAIERFTQEADRQLQKLSAYLEQIGMLSIPKSVVMEGNTIDAVCMAKDFKEKCDLIITSPPYATALPYLDTDRLSILALGLMHRKEFPNRNQDMVGNREISEGQRKELWNVYQQRKSDLTDDICAVIDKIASQNHAPGVGFRKRNLPALLAKYFLDMYDSIKAADALLKPGAMAFYVVGNNSTKLGEEKFVIETNALLWDLAEKIGWEKMNYIDMDMLKATLGYQNNRSTAEAVLIFRKRG